MRKLPILLTALTTLTACGGGEPEHPWLAIPENVPYQLIEAEGPGEGQLVIAVPGDATPQEAIDLGRLILQQAPTDAVVNARIYNDEATARNWRTVEAQWTLEHLWVLARRTGDGEDEVRWVGPPDVEGAPQPAPGEVADTLAALADSASAAP
jgi:hypothetical protein